MTTAGRVTWSLIVPPSTSRPTTQRLVRLALDDAGERRLRPAEVLGEELPDLVRVAVDLLLAEEDQVRLLLLDERLQRAGDEVAVELVVGRVDADGAVGAGRERLRAASAPPPSGRR